MFSWPFFEKEENFFDKLRVPIDVDESTIYQQYKRMDMYLKGEFDNGRIGEDEFEAKKSEFDFLKTILMNPTSRVFYMRFGDLVQYNIKKPTALVEPRFLLTTATAFNYVLWIGSAVFGICYYLPSGALLTIGLYLLGVFSIEIETRFLDANAILTYLFFLPKNDWTPFELIAVLKQSVVGITCAIVIFCGIFVRGQELGRTKYLIREILRGNAAVIALLKDPNIKELPDLGSDKEAEVFDEEDANVGSWINRGIAMISLASFILFRNSGE
jgi:hypothetical protein